MIDIQTNVNSLVAQQNLNTNSIFQSKTIEQLTSGYRINSSGDDAAGLAVANKFRSMVAELTQGVANGNDGTASLQIMDGGMNNISQILDRLKTLAMQSASESFTGDRSVLNSEFQSDLQEIDRQAQSIGLNVGGTFAKSMAIYLGAGGGSQSASNSVVNVDLSNATVDSSSLGLVSNQAVNSNVYDLSDSSNTSVSKILGSANGTPANIGFTFFGSGFANNGIGNQGNGGVQVTVSTKNITDMNSLVSAINAQIQQVASGTTAQDAAFKAANITASVVTDASGNQKLAFNSNVSGFEVQAGGTSNTNQDQASNALLGNFATTGAPGGQAASSYVVGTNWAGEAAANVSNTGNVVLSLAGAGIATAFAITLTGGSITVATAVAEINAVIASQTGVTGVTAQIMGGGVMIGDVNGTLTVASSVTNSGTGSTMPGFGATQTDSYGMLVAGNTYELGNATSQVSNLQYTGTLSGAQTLALTVVDSTGQSHGLTINLGNTTTQTLNSTIGNINDQIQSSYDPYLQSVTAVKTNTNGVDTINFVSTQPNFSVNIGSTAQSTSLTNLGISDGTGAQGKTVYSVQNGTSGAADISTVQGAQAAVTAITAAVAALGSAQADVGKGENQLGFAISLAQSQITNFSAAEANIRDANVAQEAANLTKAQTLQQASIAAMAQANSAPQAVLALLRG